MNSILTIRDLLRKVYAGYGAVIKPLFKIVLAFFMLSLIEKQMGYSNMLARPVVICAASVICAFFPYGFISFVCAIFVIGNMFEVSVMMAGFTALVGMLIFVLYYGYKPGTGIIISIVPLMFYFKLPFIVPVILGLSVGFYSAVPAALGVVCWNVISYFLENADSMTSAGGLEIADEIISVARTIFTNEYMYLVIFAFILCIAAVSIISKSSLNHCWLISVSVGIVILAAVMVLGGSYLGSDSFTSDIIGLLISFILAFAYVSVIYAVDFSRTEHLSYEDDDYYYYVKAVPKIRTDKNER
ncbi:MAG: hypothetical protein Q4E57_04200 [Eubacteriales bacterium]|nr:hypothetical protein [Eubacteriales bacterium]